jgi:hypothetical protein
MVSASEGWAWGNDMSGGTVFLHISGDTWQRVTVALNAGAPPTFVQVLRMRTADDGWLVVTPPKDTTGTLEPSPLFHYTGDSWHRVQTPLFYFSDIAPVGPDEAWLLGSDGQGQCTCIVHVQQGTATIALRVPQGDIGLSRLRALAPDDIWATGARYSSSPSSPPEKKDLQTPVVYHYNGSSWQPVDVNAPAGVQQVEVLAADDMWATLTVVPRASSGQQVPPESNIQVLYHYSSGTWRQVALPYADLVSVSFIPGASTPDDLWAYGTYLVLTPDPKSDGSAKIAVGQLVLLHYANGTWTEYGR